MPLDEISLTVVMLSSPQNSRFFLDRFESGFGRWDFFQHQLRDIDLVKHKGNREPWHWKKMLSVLSGWFDDKDGPAVRIPFRLLGRPN